MEKINPNQATIDYSTVIGFWIDLCTVESFEQNEFICV